MLSALYERLGDYWYLHKFLSLRWHASSTRAEGFRVSNAIEYVTQAYHNADGIYCGIVKIALAHASRTRANMGSYVTVVQRGVQ